LLSQLKKAGYQPTDLAGENKYLDRLQQEPFAYRGALSQLEVVPYNVLWRHLLGRLQ
jgi:hypothetical protein